MNILIVEDEKPAAHRLRRLLEEIAPDLSVIDRFDSIEDTVAYLKRFPAPDLIFLDIQLADGMSFEIFRQVEVSSPIIFTTAFDQYALQAFKVNSIDYLLKPIDPEELKGAIQKFRSLHVQGSKVDYEALLAQIESTNRKLKKRFLLKSGSKLIYIETDQVAYFFSQDSSTFITDTQGKQFLHEMPLDELEQQLDPTQFFRISRSMIINLRSIEQIEPYMNGRLILELNPNFEEQVFVSRQRVREFKEWLDK